MAELNRSKDRERQKQIETAEAQRAVEVSARRLQQQEQEIAKAEERLREIERLLAEQTREVDLQRQNGERFRMELGQAQAREQDATMAENEARRDVNLAADRAAEGEADVAMKQERERAAAAALRDAANEVARQLAQRDVDQRELLVAREREALKKAEEMTAGQAVDTQERNVAQLEQETIDFAARRRSVDDEERPLLEQEIKLREQRDGLEAKESKLRTDFQSFTGRTTRTGSPVRAGQLGLAKEIAPPLPVPLPVSSVMDPVAVAAASRSYIATTSVYDSLGLPVIGHIPPASPGRPIY